MGEKIALGTNCFSMAVAEKPSTIDDKVESLVKQVEELTRLIHSMSFSKNRPQYKDTNSEFYNANKDGIPVGISLLGSSVKNGIQVLTVNNDGYYIGITKYDSLSAAAEASSGVRRSGWVYWKLPDGRTVKDAFGKK